jgi:hypothetical protein
MYYLMKEFLIAFWVLVKKMGPLFLAWGKAVVFAGPVATEIDVTVTVESNLKTIRMTET